MSSTPETKYYYTVYGLQIESEIEFPDLPGGNGSQDIIYRLASSHGDVLVNMSAWEVVNRKLAVLRVVGVGTFRMIEGRSVEVIVEPQVDMGLVRAYLLGTLMSCLLYQRGWLVLHASAVQVGTSAVAFLGRSGWGKSSAAAALAARGHRLLTDDTAPVGLGRAATILAGVPQLKIDPSVATVLGFEERSLIPLCEGEPKRVLRLSGDTICQPVPIQCLYFLGGGVGIREMGAADRVIQLIRNSYPTQLGEPGDAEHLAKCGRLAKEVAMFRLGRGADLSTLPDLARTVEEHMAHQLAPRPEEHAAVYC